MYNPQMQIANFFSMNRLVLAPIFFIIYFIPDLFDGAAAISACILIPLFIYMQLTDFFDGFFARKLKIVSDFGKLLDPFTDVLANITVFFTFVLSGYMPAFFFLIIIYREMGIQFVRTLSAQSGIVIAASMAGKTKTVTYIAAGGFSLLIESMMRLNFAIAPATIGVLKTANTALYALATLLSVLSFASYLKAFLASRKPK